MLGTQMLNQFQPQRVLIGTLGYLLITFPLAYTWHLVLFAQTYDELGYISRESPIIEFGFIAILSQGVLLAVIYPYLCGNRNLLSGASLFALVMGGYHWTAHVLAAAAKQSIEPLTTWFALETTYLLVQFGLGGLLFAYVYRQAACGTSGGPDTCGDLAQ